MTSMLKQISHSNNFITYHEIKSIVNFLHVLVGKISQYKELFSYMLDYSKKLLFAFDFRAEILKLSD
ncbi:hypothetical protein H5410_064771 [Solanum commersonii]|uniref:Uncharacterized protein n=1 Tax=Solanum commersonii TaxID=4109 RepID=A0A9J5VYG3_SOLCO|nr:hypothetical protein H5410_064771 [Solanum commersonii]